MYVLQGTPEDKARLEQSFTWKSEYQRGIGGPIWSEYACANAAQGVRR